MSNIKKLMMSAAGGGALDVDDVFSTYLFTGNGTSQTITNGLDLAGEGGLIWTKRRDGSSNHQLYDTARGIDNVLNIVNNAGQYDYSGDITSVNSDGFSVGYYSGGLNYSNRDYATWSFRKAPKFFDVVTYTGNGVSGRTISHNLGTTVGMISIKRTDNQGGWWTLHRGSAGVLRLDSTAEAYNASSTAAYYGNGTTVITPTSTEFTVHSASEVNANNGTYVAYLWAHNDGDGEFGPDGDQDIIKCGSYTGNSQGEYNDNGVEVNLGFEPQYIMIKNITYYTGQSWQIYDTMRGITARPTTSSRDGDDAVLYANQTYAEVGGSSFLRVTPTGFKLESDNYDVNNNFNYIYMAIRRGSLFQPESATDVFAAAYQNAVGTEPGWTSGFPVDMVIDSNVGGGSTDDRIISSRLTQGRYLNLNTYIQEYAWADGYAMDYMDGWRASANNGPSDFSWMWKRAPGFFDVVAYTGNGVGPRNVPHNLGVAPEMIWNKTRTQNDSWFVYHKDVPLDSATQTGGLIFQSNGTPGGYGSFGEHSGQTATTFEIAPTNDPSGNNENGTTFMAYLFATLDGISKVGSYTGNGSNQTINCGFSAGARFILIKRIDANGDWYVWDTVRGINAGSETALIFNSTLATYNDSIDPANSGFIVNQISATNINVSNADYIFYAIA